MCWKWLSMKLNILIFFSLALIILFKIYLFLSIHTKPNLFPGPRHCSKVQKAQMWLMILFHWGICFKFMWNFPCAISPTCFCLDTCLFHQPLSIIYVWTTASPNFPLFLEAEAKWSFCASLQISTISQELSSWHFCMRWLIVRSINLRSGPPNWMNQSML